MTNHIYTAGLTRTELQTLKVLLPVTFPILSCDTEQLDEKEIEHIADQARCIVLNPKHLSAHALAHFLYEQEDRRIRCRPVPILLLTDSLTREQRRTVPLPDHPLPEVNLRRRLDRNRNIAVKRLREAAFPCWQNRAAMRANMFNDAWYLIDLETTGLDVWKDNLLAIRLARMVNDQIRETYPTIYIRQSEPLPEGISRLTGITDEMAAQGISLEEAVGQLESLPCDTTPFLFTGEDYTAGFLNAAFLRCGKAFTRPYVAIDKLAQIPFGYLMQRRARNIPPLADPGLSSDQFSDDPLQELYELTRCVFAALRTRYDVRCPGQFDKLYAAELSD